MSAKHQSAEKRVRELACRWGVCPDYYDIFGERRETSVETCVALLRAMGIDPDDPACDESPAVHVVRPGLTVAVRTPSELLLEDGTTLRVGKTLPPDLPLGYHELRPLNGRPAAQVISSPAHCFLEPTLRTWGWAVQLYAVRSAQSWGLGDLADLRRLGRWAAKLGAGAVLVNPLTAAAPTLPQQPSPYYPSSRRFRNPLYVSIADVPGANEAGRPLERLQAAARQLNHERRIDRNRVYELKLAALDLLWKRRVPDPGFEAFCREHGASLHGFAVYCTLAERWGADWRLWKPAYRRPDAPAVVRFAKQESDRVAFHKWLQWLLDRQLALAAEESPLVQDLPIGVDPGGADAWQWQDVLASHVSVGAPPDHFNVNGQDWGLPPFIPHRMRAARYQPFIETLRAAFRHARGLRIDHVMGLFRLFWIPAGAGSKAGTYVRYPADELMAIVALESHRAGAWVAGEDLGTVEPDVRRRLAENCMLTYRLAWFEDTRPRQYPELAMAAITTHDLPTVAGLWSGEDFAAQQALGMRPDEAEYRRIRKRLKNLTRLRSDAPIAEVITQAYAALAASPARVVVANLEDALAVAERPNMPGTIDQWPNWSIALPQTLEKIRTAKLPQAIAAAINQARG